MGMSAGFTFVKEKVGVGMNSCFIFVPGVCSGPTKPVVYCLVSSVFAFGLYDRILTELEHYVEVSEAAAWDFLKNAFDTSLPTQIREPTEIESPLPDKFGNLEVDRCLLRPFTCLWACARVRVRLFLPTFKHT